MSDLDARALAALDDYLDLPSASRREKLDALRDADPSLHAAVTALLEADARDDALVRSPQEILSGYGAPADAATTTEDDARIGTVVGHWRIESVIGRGGMGTVYRASRADGHYAQEVALKCVSLDEASPLLADAIRNEYRTLAMLEHPHIATLLDAGIDAADDPWFAMQWIHGEPIDRWCDARRLGLRARVELFDRLCDGLAFAHGKGAVHADIKPANVLVDANGRPVLVDFGLSSLSIPGWAPRQRQVAMTLGYTAPEVAADGYSEKSDLYSLGMLLHALLSGERRRANLAAHMTADVALPSEAALQGRVDAATSRGFATPAALSRALAGDFDEIVMGCVATDPAERYASVALLQQDLRAALAGRPLSVLGDRAGYRARLFLQRHRMAAAAAALAVVLLASGVGVALHLSRQAAQHADEARAMRTMFEDSFDILTVTNVSRSPLLSASRLAVAEEGLRRRSAGSAPRVRAFALLALAKSYAASADYGHAAALIDEARKLSADDVDQQVLVDATQAHLLNIQARFAQALRAARHGLGQLDAVAAADRDAARLALDVEFARALRGSGRIRAGQAALAQAMRLAETRAAHDPTPLAELLILRGEWAAIFYRFDDAQRDYRRAIALTERPAPVIADNARADLAASYSFNDQSDRAVPIARAVLANRQRMFGETHPETGKAWVLLATTEYWSRTSAPSEYAAKRGEAILRAALGPDHPEVPRATKIVGLTRPNSTPQALDQTIAEARRGLAITQRAHGPATTYTIDAMTNLAGSLAIKADTIPSASGLWPEVIALYARAVKEGMQQGLPMLSPRVFLVKAKLRVGQTDVALERELTQLIDDFARTRGPLNERALETRLVLVEFYRASKQPEQARMVLESLIADASRARTAPSVQSTLSSAHSELAAILLEQGEPDLARSHWQQAYAISLRLNGPDYPYVKWLAAQLRQLHEKASSAKR